MRAGPPSCGGLRPTRGRQDLRERVLRRGFDRVEDTAAMAMDLARLPEQRAAT